jgi:predicted ATPase
MPTSRPESFLALFANRFDRGIYLLDEPEAALSPRRQLSFLKIVNDLESAGRAQFLIATHSPLLLAYPGATLLSLDGDSVDGGDGITAVNYRDTDHFRLTRDFLAAPERFFRHLFDQDQADPEPDR